MLIGGREVERYGDLVDAHVLEAGVGGERPQCVGLGEREQPARAGRGSSGDQAVHHGRHAEARHPRVVLGTGPHGGREPPTGPQDATALAERLPGLRYEHQPHAADDGVERCVLQARGRCVHLGRAGLRPVLQRVCGEGDHPRGGVGGQDLPAFADLVGEPQGELTGAGGQLEDPVSGAERERGDQRVRHR